MRAIYAFGPKDVRLVTVADPRPGSGQALVKVLASGICGSDKWLWRVTGPTTNIAGHEIAGEVVELGPDTYRLKVGDRVAINNVVGCGVCPACRAGVYVKCPNWTGAQDVNGGFGEYVAASERNCLRLDDAVDIQTGAQIFDNYGTPFSAIEQSGIRAGDDVVVSGCGPIGLAAVHLASLKGAFVIAVDALPNRLALAQALGAGAVCTPGAGMPGCVREFTQGKGADYVLECSGKSPAYPPAFDSLRTGGKLVSVGEGAQYDLRPSDTLIRRHLTIQGSWYSSMGQGAQIQTMILTRQIDPRVLVSHTAPLAEFPALFAKVCDQPDEVIKALIVNE